MCSLKKHLCCTYKKFEENHGYSRVLYLWKPETGWLVSGRYSESLAKKPPYSGMGSGRGCGTSTRGSCGVGGALPPAPVGVTAESGHSPVCMHL